LPAGAAVLVAFRDIIFGLAVLAAVPALRERVR